MHIKHHSPLAACSDLAKTLATLLSSFLRSGEGKCTTPAAEGEKDRCEEGIEIRGGGVGYASAARSEAMLSPCFLFEEGPEAIAGLLVDDLPLPLLRVFAEDDDGT
jgi:hypothetical protein